jgi:hypothetical protein
MAAGLEERAAALLEANTRVARQNGTSYRITVPSPGAYPFQWFWDSCFHAIVWSRFDRARAADELRALLAWQEPNGFVPHVVFWDQSSIRLRSVWHYLESRGIPFVRKPLVSAYVQPPILAQALERIGAPFALEALPAAARFYRYLARERDPDRDGLVSIVAQFESGIDYSPAYSEASGLVRRNPLAIYFHARRGEVRNRLLGFDLERIFRTTDHHHEDVLFNTLYADGLHALARLARAAGDDQLVAWAEAAAARVVESLLDRCWDERAGLFFNLYGRRERRVTRRTIISLLPLLLAELPRDVTAKLVERLVDRRTFWTPFPVASVARDERGFTRNHRVWGIRFIWRGPSSLNTNWLLVNGLRRHGYDEQADDLAARSRELVERGGFNEFFDPVDGTPVGAPDFGWATLAVDL